MYNCRRMVSLFLGVRGMWRDMLFCFGGCVSGSLGFYSSGEAEQVLLCKRRSPLASRLEGQARPFPERKTNRLEKEKGQKEKATHLPELSLMLSTAL